MAMTTEQLLVDRGTTHGDFADHARITQSLKYVYYSELYAREKRDQTALTFTQKESIEMIFHKLGRIIAGEPSFADHWDDIAGYAKIANKV